MDICIIFVLVVVKQINGIINKRVLRYRAALLMSILA
jgi:hypothetical protein